MAHLNSEKWTQLWNETSWINSFGETNYDSDIVEFWHKQLEGITGKVIDLGCGNGAISWIANEKLNQDEPSATVTGIDFSDIQPFKKLNLLASDYPMLNFLGSTPIEKLPFDDATIDLAISQYGLEYSNLNLAIPEISRVLKSTAKVCFILHSKQSRIIKETAVNLAQYNSVLYDVKLHDKFFDLDTIINNAENPEKLKDTPEFIAKSIEIQGRITIMKNIIKTARNPVPLNKYMQSMAAVFSKQALLKGTVDRRSIILKARNDFKNYLERIADLQSAALSADTLKELVKLLEKESFSITGNEALKYKDSNNHGHIIVAQRG